MSIQQFGYWLFNAGVVLLFATFVIGAWGKLGNRGSGESYRRHHHRWGCLAGLSAGLGTLLFIVGAILGNLK